MLSQILTIIAAVASILPGIITAVQTGKIKSGAEDEVLAALSAKFNARVQAANDAAKEITDETNDVNNRTNS